VKRGEVWTASAGGSYVGKPRLVVIVQDDRFDAIESVTVVPVTSDATEAQFRVVVEPGASNGLRDVSRLMVDKVTTVRKARLGHRLGTLSADDMRRVDRAMLVFLGLAG
jgi:mRNA interferase MazF